MGKKCISFKVSCFSIVSYLNLFTYYEFHSFILELLQVSHTFLQHFALKSFSFKENYFLFCFKSSFCYTETIEKQSILLKATLVQALPNV